VLQFTVIDVADCASSVAGVAKALATASLIKNFIVFLRIW